MSCMAIHSYLCRRITIVTADLIQGRVFSLLLLRHVHALLGHVGLTFPRRRFLAETDGLKMSLLVTDTKNVFSVGQYLLSCFWHSHLKQGRSFLEGSFLDPSHQLSVRLLLPVSRS